MEEKELVWTVDGAVELRHTRWTTRQCFRGVFVVGILLLGNASASFHSVTRGYAKTIDMAANSSFHLRLEVNVSISGDDPDIMEMRRY